MFCPECGTKILDNSVYCSECGTKIVRTPETSVETEGIVARKEPEKPAVDSFTPYKGLIVCAVIMRNRFIKNSEKRKKTFFS